MGLLRPFCAYWETVSEMTSNATSRSKVDRVLIVLVTGVAGLILLVVLNFASIRDYLGENVTGKAVVPMVDYGVKDIEAIVSAANSNHDEFVKSFSGKNFAVEADFVGISGNAPYVISTKTRAGAVVTCSLNRFAFETKKDALTAFKAGDAVHIRGVIDPATKGTAIALGNGCAVERSYAGGAVN